MFEYINIGFIVLSGILLFMLILLLILRIGESTDRNTKVNKTSISWITFFIFVSISIPLLDSYITKTSIEENIQEFNKLDELRCTSGFNAYLVSRNSNWKLKNDYFIKNDLLIRSDKCQIINEHKGYNHDSSN